MSTLPQQTPELTQSQGSPGPLSQTTGPPLSERPANNLVQHDQGQIARSQPREGQQQEEQATPPVLSQSEQQQQIQPQSDINTSKSSTSPISSSISPLVNSQNQSSAQLQSLATTSLILPPSQASTYPDNYNKVNNTAYDSKTNNTNDADNIASNSMPQSTIKVTSIDRSTEPGVTLSISNSTKQQYQSDEREQLQQRIQEIMNQFSSANSNDVASLPKYIERN